MTPLEMKFIALNNISKYGPPLHHDSAPEIQKVAKTIHAHHRRLRSYFDLITAVSLAATRYTREKHNIPSPGGDSPFEVFPLLDDKNYKGPFETDIGIYSVFTSMVVNAWTAYETTAQDLWVSSVNNRPKTLGRSAIKSLTKSAAFLQNCGGDRKESPKHRYIGMDILE